MKHLVVFILMQFLILYNSILHADWIQTNGPGGGYVSSIAVAGPNILAGVSKGLFISNNDGTSWSQLNNSPSGVHALLVDGTKIYAGTWEGMFLSTDNGNNWISLGLTNHSIRSLSISGTNIFAGTDTSGVYKSTNNGISWTQVNDGLTNNYINALAKSGSNIFAGTNAGVFLSTNNGALWTQVNNGLNSYFVFAFAISGANIYAGTHNGVFLSTDNGASWKEVSNGLNDKAVNSLAISGSTIFAGIDWPDNGGVYRSTDNGTNWTQVSLDGYMILSLAADGNKVFAGAEVFGGSNNIKGLFRSMDNGINWQQVGLPIRSVKALNINGGNIFAADEEGGVYISTDNGGNWEETKLNYYNRTYGINAITSKGTNVFAGDRWYGIFLSTDNGVNWTPHSNGLTSTHIYSLVTDGNNIYSGNEHGLCLSTNNGDNWVSLGLTSYYIRAIVLNGKNIFACADSVFLSTNNGTSWTQVNNGLTYPVNALTIKGTNIFAGSGGGVFVSSNNGTSWVQVNNGLIDPGVRSLVVSGNNIFAGTISGVFLSTNDGANWMHVGMNSFTILSLAANETTIFAGTDSAAVWKRPLSEIIPVTTNCPLSQGYWKNHPSKWPAVLPMMLGTLNSYSQSKLLSILGTPVKGDASLILAHQLIAAKLNVANNSPLPNEVQNAIANSDAAIGTAIIPAGVKPNSVLGQTMTSLAAILDKYNNGLLTLGCQPEQMPALEPSKFNDQFGSADNYELLGNFPEPFNPTTKISFILPEANFVTLKIYNSVGQLVKTLVNENMNKGYHTLEWNATNDNGNNLATGIYIYRLQAGNFVKTSKMIFMK